MCTNNSEYLEKKGVPEDKQEINKWNIKLSNHVRECISNLVQTILSNDFKVWSKFTITTQNNDYCFEKVGEQCTLVNGTNDEILKKDKWITSYLVLINNQIVFSNFVTSQVKAINTNI